MVSTNHIFSVFAFTGFILMDILLPLHIKARNIGTSAFIIWASLLCFNGFVNSIVWNDNVTNWAPVWCDISSRLMIGGGIGIQSACLCIARDLYHVTSNVISHRRAQGEHKRLWRAILRDYFFVLGIPVLRIVLSYTIQFNRFYIMEDAGCFYALENTPLTYPLFTVWPGVIGIIVALYVCATVRKLIQRRARFKAFMQHDDQFLRLLAVVIVIPVCSFTPSIWNIVNDVTQNPALPWPGWGSMHANISHVEQFTILDLGAQNATLQVFRWAFVIYAVIFFAFFGFTTGAKRHYRLVFAFFRHRSDSGASCVEDMRMERAASCRIPALSASARRTSGRLYLPPYLSAISLDDLQRISRSRDSCIHELSEQEFKSNLELRPDHVTCRSSEDRGEEHMPTLPSIPVQPSPVLDIMSILHRHSADV
ncbi:hypothetical protein SERLA73DRAFT_159532 [Serpula lacrymans var. lacrymans S7.3]|uniref:Uncharacterized protein n=2 Tax=Serpula lacrymans var. lacrymans TaxID=341189 RepID=F8PT73_SERL3|nr:uncharacterized protein SERLADRAFT_436337 [Serpula lacrymans var. lacrymans S7.9]EGO00903.1 hypothetical protein SERLA73DRAFT_159532 [Serpula lacrymans var. lacrymans S7.3]EGO26518.1 hypothetical protein SERLADRAFT_436337 [Serpula lacrymans var. lacrymans S7.9]